MLLTYILYIDTSFIGGTHWIIRLLFIYIPKYNITLNKGNNKITEHRAIF